MPHALRLATLAVVGLTGCTPTDDPDLADSSTTSPASSSTSSSTTSSTPSPTTTDSTGAASPTTSPTSSTSSTGPAPDETSTGAPETTGTNETTTASPDLGGDEPASRCDETPTTIVCPKITVELGPWQRDVHYQVPLGEPPPAGWPTVLMFQGSFFSAEVTWLATDDLPFGAFFQTLVVKRLLDHGYAVITPETKLDGGTFWDTNVPPYSLDWASSEDHALMLALFKAIDDGTFGPLDPAQLFATGVSSGGYMSSRVALAYPGRFRSIAVAAASYMTCSGPLCDVPALAPDHPPTLLLHGGVDLTVPLWTAEDYHEALLAAGVDTRLVVDPAEGHGWIPASPDEVLTWFDDHP